MPTNIQDVSDYVRRQNTLKTINIDTKVIDPLKSKAVRRFNFYNPRYKLLSNTLQSVVDNRIRSFQQSIVAGALNVEEFLNGFGTSSRFKVITRTFYLNKLLFISDRNYHTIRSYNISTGQVSTVAGQNGGQAADVDGTTLTALFNYMDDMTIDTVRNIIYTNSIVIDLIRIVDLNTKMVSSKTITYTPGIYRIYSITYANDFLYGVEDGDVIYKIDLASSTASVIAGLATASGNTDGIGTAARFNIDVNSKIISDGSKNLFIIHRSLGSDYPIIRKLNIETNEVTTLNSSRIGIFNEGSVSYSPSDNSLYYLIISATLPVNLYSIVRLDITTNTETVVVKSNYSTIRSLSVVSPELLYMGVENAIAMIKYD